MHAVPLHITLSQIPEHSPDCVILWLLTLQIGFFVALGAELATEQSIFRSVTPSEAVTASAVLLGAILLAAAAAAANKRQNLGVDIKEAVITSMTAVRRSAASVTGKQVDFAVDNVLSKVFDMGVIYSLLADDDVL
jgi:hypothetical protein